jgi:hypothetical protein
MELAAESLSPEGGAPNFSPSSLRSLFFNNRALNIGVNVNETSIETMIEKAIVQPN